ncbi:MAG: dTDP-4-dehydrorhamnose 3,5-epimerase [Azospira oryzae]|jgi:dTDP-4-dehydrorhamnose 3,5-epimerase|nr:MAG: dTDP-4-dehydrorhamnose 3,5-epimerase [Azospira oryzae]
MKITPTGFKDLFVLEPAVFGDERGYFMESFNRKTLLAKGIELNFVQDNQSSSKKGVLRGLHFQNPPYAQTKLVRALSGSILDVVVDIRKNEPTFGEHFSVELTADNKKQLLVPKGFAHGFVVLSEQAEVFYKCDEYYNPQAEGGVSFNDSDLNIDWKFDKGELTVSQKDLVYPSFKEIEFQF